MPFAAPVDALHVPNTVCATDRLQWRYKRRPSPVRWNEFQRALRRKECVQWTGLT